MLGQGGIGMLSHLGPQRRPVVGGNAGRPATARRAGQRGTRLGPDQPAENGAFRDAKDTGNLGRTHPGIMGAHDLFTEITGIFDMHARQPAALLSFLQPAHASLLPAFSSGTNVAGSRAEEVYR